MSQPSLVSLIRTVERLHIRLAENEQRTLKLMSQVLGLTTVLCLIIIGLGALEIAWPR